MNCHQEVSILKFVLEYFVCWWIIFDKAFCILIIYTNIYKQLLKLVLVSPRFLCYQQ